VNSSQKHALNVKTLPTSTKPKARHKKSGLGFWMRNVLEECDRASVAFAPDPVHDLRVSLRRCCSMADGMAAIDPDPEWKEMKKAGKRLFRRLGELRDVHVMQEWVHRLDSPDDPVTGPLLQAVSSREAQLQQEAMQAVTDFDRKQWQRWSLSLPRRMARFRPGSLIFRHLALERWTDAHQLHRQALRSGSHAAWHRLRIGIKRFRYIVENFLPKEYDAWSDDLKRVQDALGDVHDLDVLWPAAVQANVFPDEESRFRWRNRIEDERRRRIEDYRKDAVAKTPLKKIGPRKSAVVKEALIPGTNENKPSLWQLWRSALPDKKQTESAALLRLQIWASLLDPDFRHSRHITRLTLELYDGLAALGKPSESFEKERAILRAAALLHDIGKSKNERGHHKASYRMIKRLTPPLGWPAQDLLTAGIVARYHRGSLPRAGQAPLRGLSPKQRQDVSRLAAILRLANAFDAARDGRIQRLQVRNGADRKSPLLIAAQGYLPRDNQAEAIAAGRHLLEIVYRRPVIIQGLRPETSASRAKLGA
jgi:CHAD domain-containing protein